jgi:NTP pyrophosphatase (non-canonical NTP hydrolase)
MTPYERVTLSRQRTAATFPFPALRPCIDYAICEFAGELRDAVLRDERATDVRNNDRAHSQQKELGDSFYMLLSACIQADHEPQLHPIVGTYAFRRHCNEIVRYLTYAADHAARLDGETTSYDGAHDGVCRNLDHAYSYMVGLCLHGYGWNVDTLIDETCNRFEAKHVPAQEPR